MSVDCCFLSLLLSSSPSEPNKSLIHFPIRANNEGTSSAFFAGSSLGATTGAAVGATRPLSAGSSRLTGVVVVVSVSASTAGINSTS